jgi:ribonucleoside-triphosphate reductase
MPYFSNFINSDMNSENTCSICCHLRIYNTKLDKRGGGFFGADPLMGSVGVVTINLPRISFLANLKAEFLSGLSSLMERASESLKIKRELLEKLALSNLHGVRY